MPPTDDPAPPDQPLPVLRQAIQELSRESPESARLAEFHIYLGMSLAEIAIRLEIPSDKADELWLHARHWLQRSLELRGEPLDD